MLLVDRIVERISLVDTGFQSAPLSSKWGSHGRQSAPPRRMLVTTKGADQQYEWHTTTLQCRPHRATRVQKLYCLIRSVWRTFFWPGIRSALQTATGQRAHRTKADKSGKHGYDARCHKQVCQRCILAQGYDAATQHCDSRSHANYPFPHRDILYVKHKHLCY